jgi:16S rRNA G966 N2-methylase RsmD
MLDLATNVLCCGDNLDTLRGYLPDPAVDLVYLDPPFDSNRDYKVTQAASYDWLSRPGSALTP